MIPFLKQRWFLILLAFAMVIGIGGGPQLKGIVEHKWLRDADVAFVLFLMALPLEASAIWQTIRRPYASLLAVFVTFGILPLVAWGVSFLLTGGQGPGLLIAAATPCTVASAAVWTRRAGGNDAVATMVTLITNAICFVVTPLWLIIFLGPDARVGRVGVPVGSASIGTHRRPPHVRRSTSPAVFPDRSLVVSTQTGPSALSLSWACCSWCCRERFRPAFN
jgi:predicted Na+-dependent transporter